MLRDSNERNASPIGYTYRTTSIIPINTRNELIKNQNVTDHPSVDRLTNVR